MSIDSLLYPLIRQLRGRVFPYTIGVTLSRGKHHTDLVAEGVEDVWSGGRGKMS